MAEVYVTLGEAAELEGVKYKTMAQRLSRKKETFVTKTEKSETGGKDVVLVAVSSLSKQARNAWKEREKLKSFTEEFPDKKEDEQKPEVPWYVNTDVDWYIENYKERYYKAVELGNVVRKFLQYDEGDRTKYAEEFAQKYLGKGQRTLYRYTKAYLEASAWADKLEKEDGAGREFFKVLCLCRKPKETGCFPSIKPEVKQVIKNIWFNEDFARNQGTREMLYEKLTAIANINKWEKIPSYQTVTRYISYLMEDERFFRTVCNKFTRWMKSYTGTLTGSKTSDKVDKDIKRMLERGELLTLEEFYEKWHEWLTTVYMHTEHSGLKKMGETYKKPYDCFMNEDRYFKAAPPKSYATMLMMKSENVLVRNIGITKWGYEYRSDELCDYIGRKVDIKYDPDDMAVLYVFDQKGKLINKYTQKKMEILRGIFDQSNVGIVIAGEPRLETELKGNLARFANRMDFYYKLKGLSKNEVVDYLEGYEVDEAAMGEMISRATNTQSGCFRLLDRTLNNVLRILKQKGETRITMKIVSEASNMMML